MRIIYIHQYFHTLVDAGSTRSLEFATRLAIDGIDVHVLSATSVGAPFRGWRSEAVEGFVVHRTYVEYRNDMSYRRRVGAFGKFAAACTSRVLRMPADVIFATSTPLTTAIPGLAGSSLRRRDFIFEVRDLWPEMPIAMGALKNPVARAAAKKLEALAYRRASGIVTLSTGMTDRLIERGVPAWKISTIPNIAHVELFAEARTQGANWRASRDWLRPSDSLVVYLGQIGRVNGLRYIIDVAREALSAGDNMQFLLVGDGAERDALVRYAVDFGVMNENVHIFPAVPKAHVPSLLGAADLALSIFDDIPGMEVNSANKFFDALAAGVPAGINYGGWQADLLRRTGAGLVLPREPRAAYNLLSASLRDREWLLRAGEAARALAHEYSLEVAYMKLKGALLGT